ncbi:MAG: hypothetical protein ACI96M_000194 [Candidatus Azotimanducaceae bacterium]|jgi:hypothetical protein
MVSYFILAIVESKFLRKQKDQLIFTFPMPFSRLSDIVSTVYMYSTNCHYRCYLIALTSTDHRLEGQRHEPISTCSHTRPQSIRHDSPLSPVVRLGAINDLETALADSWLSVTQATYRFLVLLREFEMRQGWRAYG